MTKIDWATETINPLGWGCYGTGTAKEPKICEYCYAYRIAKRGLRNCDLCNQFVPHTHFEQLEKLSKWKKPRTIFIQSMGDLFHAEVPDSWIETVFEACQKAPQHRYLFLTKNPQRYESLAADWKLPFPMSADDEYDDSCLGYEKDIDFWYGRTVTHFEQLTSLDWCCDFISIEPIQGDNWVDFSLWIDDYKPKWVIIGMESGNRKDKIIPKREWIEDVVNACDKANVPLFMKNNIADIWQDELIQQFPWGCE